MTMKLTSIRPGDPVLVQSGYGKATSATVIRVGDKKALVELANGVQYEIPPCRLRPVDSITK